MKRLITFLVMLVALFPLLVFPVLANSPPGLENGEAVVSAGSVILVLVVVAVQVALALGTTCFIEWLVARLFHLGKHNDKLIIRTNLVSQLIMWAMFFTAVMINPTAFIRFLWDRYWLFLICLELPIYVGEFLVYRKKMWEISWWVCLLYTVTANTSSLLLGLFFNGFLV